MYTLQGSNTDNRFTILRPKNSAESCLNSFFSYTFLGTSEFTLVGTFNKKRVTRITFSDGIKQATLFVKNLTDGK